MVDNLLKNYLEVLFICLLPGFTKKGKKLRMYNLRVYGAAGIAQHTFVAFETRNIQAYTATLGAKALKSASAKLLNKVPCLALPTNKYWLMPVGAVVPIYEMRFRLCRPACWPLRCYTKVTLVAN